MKTNLKNIFSMIAVCLPLLSNAVPTWAGAVVAREVEITVHPTSSIGKAHGTMGGVRYSADRVQHIGCSVNAAPSVVCSARNSAGVYLGCMSTLPAHIAAAQAMTDSSYVYFKMNRTNGLCTTVKISNHSSFLK